MTAPSAMSPLHRRRLMLVWRSAGWPCCDAVELDLLAAGMLQRQWDAQGRETLRVTDAGIALLAETRQRHRAALGAHEAMVAQVAEAMLRDGRIVWRGLSLRVALAAEDGSRRWVMTMPDVYSIRHTTVEDYVAPMVHEIKVSRADLLSDLRRPDKGRAYRELASQCWYVTREGIADERDIPPEYGWIVATGSGLDVRRPASPRAVRLPFAAWMTLARATPVPGGLDEAQGWLVDDGAA